MTHGHRDFTVCSCSLLPVLLPGGSGAPKTSMCSITADVSGEPVMRNALVKARRRIACCTHCVTGCSHAPRPGRLAPVPTITAYSPFPIGTATTRSSLTASSRFRHPMHVRTGPSVLLCALLVSGSEGSRWITAKSSVTQPMVRTTHICACFQGLCSDGRCRRPDVLSGRGPSRGWHPVPVDQSIAPANRPGCRCATR
jgi:hypothetical protein